MRDHYKLTCCSMETEMTGKTINTKVIFTVTPSTVNKFCYVIQTPYISSVRKEERIAVTGEICWDRSLIGEPNK